MTVEKDDECWDEYWLFVDLIRTSAIRQSQFNVFKNNN